MTDSLHEFVDKYVESDALIVRPAIEEGEVIVEAWEGYHIPQVAGVVLERTEVFGLIFALMDVAGIGPQELGLRMAAA